MSRETAKAIKTVLLVDDQADQWLGVLSVELAEYGFRVVAETEPTRAETMIGKTEPDVVLLDILFPSGEGRLKNMGRDVLAAIKVCFPSMPIVMFTSTLADAKLAVDQEEYPGAAYLFAKEMLGQKTTDFDPFGELARRLDQAIAEAKERRPLDERLGFVVGETLVMREVAEAILNVAPTESTVLITGESGTGKELVARAIHRLGLRRDKAFVPVNCGGLTEETLESRLFGHVKGAFTGAQAETDGFFGEAEGGILFLDEIEAMPSRLQEFLLRAVQEKRITKMGSSRERPVDVRIVAATNRNLDEAVKQGRFRDDLLGRLRVFEIALPPLRARKSDLPALFSHIVEKKNKDLGTRILPTLREDVRALLEAYDWPGNIRELENVIHTAMVKSRANVLTPGAFDRTNEAGRGEEASLGDIVNRILDGRDGWETLRDIRGDLRAGVLRDLISRIKTSEGKRPTSAALAKKLNMTEDNLRRVLSESNISLREL